MLNATFRPLLQWSGPTTKTRKEAAFRSTWVQTLDLLEYELGKLRARDVVIQIEDPNGIRGIRNDGSIRLLDQKYFPSKAGVILMFESPKGNISMPCDRYDCWRDNLRAIALSLEALRAVDRYGVTRGNEQYRGWAQLPATNGKMTRQDAIQIIALVVNADPTSLSDHWESIGEAMIKRAKKLMHPDAGDQSDENVKRHRHEMFVRIGQAEEVMSAEGGK
jgi:hypothetical protein